MTEGEIQALERDVEAARTRVVNDLARLRSPGNVAALKSNVSGQVARRKEEWTDTARGAVNSKVESVLDGLKARAAANPAAALAIGAGLAWRLAHHPPIASVLVGLGVMGLMRADPNQPGPGAGLAAKAVEFAGTTQGRVTEWREGEQASQLSGYAGQARERATELRDQASALAETARDRIGEVSVEAGETARHLMDVATGHAQHWGEAGRHSYETFRDSEDRDKYLLGAAAVAIAAAVGIASQRRH